MLLDELVEHAGNTTEFTGFAVYLMPWIVFPFNMRYCA